MDDLPEGFEVVARVARVLTCPKCGDKRHDSWPAWNVPQKGRKLMCEACDTIWTPNYPEPIFSVDRPRN